MPKALFVLPYPPILPDLTYPRPGDPTHVDGGYSMVGLVNATDGTCTIQVDTTQDNIDALAATYPMLCQADDDIEQVVDASSEVDTVAAMASTRATMQEFRGAGGHTLEEVHASLEARGFVPVCDSDGHLLLDASHQLIYVRKDGEAE
jgi:hypothetical protein